MQITQIKLKNFLSFGNSEQTIDFSDFNTIVGPNDSGKTNVFRAIELTSKLLTERMTPSESYYHNKNFEKPFKIEIKIKLNGEEKNALNNFFISSCLHREYSGTTEVRQRKGKVMDMIMAKFGNKLFEEFYDAITIVVTTSRVNHPPDIFFKLHRGEKILYFEHSDVGKKLQSRTGSRGIRGLSDMMVEFAKKQHPEINNFIENGKGKIPKFLKFQISLFDETYESTNERMSVQFGGFQFNDYEARYENTPSFLRTREFVKKIDPNEDGVSFHTLIALIFNNAIIKTADVRSRPKPVLDPENLHYQKEMINISGENITKILNSMYYSKDPKIKSQYSLIAQNFKKLTKNIELGMTLEQKRTYIPEKNIIEASHDDTFLDNRKSLEVVAGEREILHQEIGIQIIKNKIPIPLEFASSGVMELLSLLTALIGHKNKVILLDEPALNLHSILQRRILQLIQNAVTKNKNQIVIITHSPYLINPEHAKYLWKFSPTTSGTNVISFEKVLNSFDDDDQKKTIQRLHNSEVRAILFQHGIIFVEGPSDKIVLEKTDRHMTDNKLKGPNIEENEWMVLDVGGKDSMPLFINLAKKLKLPHTSVMDFDSLMQCTGKIKLGTDDVRTSSIIGYIEKTDGLSKQEQNLIKNLERTIIKKQKKNNKKIIQSCYPDEKLKQLNKIARAHNMYVLTKDLEGVIRTTATSRDSKPLKALEQITELLSQNKIPADLKSTMKFIQSKIKKR